MLVFEIGVISTAVIASEVCRDEPISKVALANGGILAGHVISTINKQRQVALDRGEDLDVVIIARKGSDLGRSVVLKDHTSDGRLATLEDIHRDLYKIESNWYGDNYRDYLIPIKNLPNLKDPKRKVVYSHIGLAFRNHPLAEKIQMERNIPNKPWVIVHMLKPCGALIPNLYDEGIWNFFLDDPYEYGAKIVVPSYALQKRIEQVVLYDKLSYNFLAPKYNIASLYNDLNEQNSNHWVLEVIAASMASRGQVRNRAEAIQVLEQTGFRPTRFYLRGIHQLAKIFGPDFVDFDTQRFAGENLVEVVTALSIVEWMQRHSLVISQHPIELKQTIEEE